MKRIKICVVIYKHFGDVALDDQERKIQYDWSSYEYMKKANIHEIYIKKTLTQPGLPKYTVKLHFLEILQSHVLPFL